MTPPILPEKSLLRNSIFRQCSSDTISSEFHPFVKSFFSINRRRSKHIQMETKKKHSEEVEELNKQIDAVFASLSQLLQSVCQFNFV